MTAFIPTTSSRRGRDQASTRALTGGSPEVDLEDVAVASSSDVTSEDRRTRWDVASLRRPAEDERPVAQAPGSRSGATVIRRPKRTLARRRSGILPHGARPSRPGINRRKGSGCPSNWTAHSVTARALCQSAFGPPSTTLGTATPSSIRTECASPRGRSIGAVLA